MNTIKYKDLLEAISLITNLDYPEVVLNILNRGHCTHVVAASILEAENEKNATLQCKSSLHVSAQET